MRDKMSGTYKRKEKVDLDMDGNEILNFIPQTVTELPTTNVKKNQIVTKDGQMYICYNPAGTTEVEIWKVFTAMPEGSNVLTDGDIGTRVAKLIDGKVPIDEIPDIGISKVTGLQAELDGKASTDVATTTKNGLMSSTDKTKLDTVKDNAEPNKIDKITAEGTEIAISNKTVNVTRSSLGLGTASTKDVGTSAGNIPVLNSDGKLDNSTIPPLAISEYAGSVDTKADLITLTNAEKGDIAQVTSDPVVNNNGVYFLNGVYSTLENWIQIVGPGAVISVNGKSGVVSLTYVDVDAVPITRTINAKALSDDITLTKADLNLDYEDGAQINVIESIAVNGVDATITGKKATVSIPNASATADGLMSKADFTKLSGIDDGAKKPVENLTSATEPPTAKTVGDEFAKYVQKNADITASTTAKLVTYDAKGLVTGGRVIQKTDLPTGVGYILEGTIAIGLTKGEFTLPTDPVIRAYNVQVYDSTGNLVDTFVNITDNKVTVGFNTATTEEHKVRIIGS